MPHEHDDDLPLTSGEQAAHFVKACSRSNTKLVTILRADLERALSGNVPANEFTAYCHEVLSKSEGKYCPIIRSKLLNACRAIVAGGE